MLPGDGLLTSRIQIIPRKLTLNCLGRVGTKWDFTNKMEFRQLAQWFCFVCNGTPWDFWLGIRKALLWPNRDSVLRPCHTKHTR